MESRDLREHAKGCIAAAIGALPLTSLDAQGTSFARVGRIDRTKQLWFNLLRCRRTEARDAAVGSMVPGPIRRGMLGAGRTVRGGQSTIINLGAGQSSDV
jgi:hypothetical protein